MEHKKGPVKPASLSEALLWQMGKLARLQFWYLATRTDVHLLSALYILACSSLSMIVMGLAAHFTSWPLIFPSLGPTTFLIFYASSRPMSCPRNCLAGHLIGGSIGMACFYLLGIFLPEHAISGSFSVPEAVTVGAALGISGMVMVLSGLLHPPAASTAMMGAMGLFSRWYDLPVLVLAVAVLCLQGIVMHRMAGIKYPFWAPLAGEQGPDLITRLGKLKAVERSNPSLNPSETDYSELAARLASRQKLSSSSEERS